MSNIRLLLLGSSPLILPRALKLSGALKVVRWSSFPFEALPLETPLDKLVHIHMWRSKIKQLWNGIHFMKNLKSINLSYSCDFTETSDLSGVPHLEHLCLASCTSLVKVHPSLGELKELVEVDLGFCWNLEVLPRKLETNSLIKLNLIGCKKVAVLPEFGEGMNTLSYLNARDTAINRLPESFGSLTGLRYLNLSYRTTLNPDQLLKPHITGQISGFNVMWLTELYLSGRGLNDGSIPDDFGMFSSLIVLDLSGNDFVNLPTGCFSSLFRLLFLSLDGCGRLKSLPRVPPRLIRLHASGCDSLEPLSERQLWNLVATVDHEYRGRTKYVIYAEEYYDDDIPSVYNHVESAECLPWRDFLTIIPGRKIPSWFPNKENCFPLHDFEIKVNIPPYVCDSEWSAIVVCLPISGMYDGVISWRSKAPEDDDYTCKEWAHRTSTWGKHQLCIMVLELNEKTCWQIYKLSTSYEVLGCGWRVICKEEIKEWCNFCHFSQLTPPLPTADEVKLRWRVLDDFFQKMPSWS